MLEVSTDVIIALPNGVKLIWALNSDDVARSISLKPQNFTTDPLGRVYIQQGTAQNIVGTISMNSKDGGFQIQLSPISTGGSSGLI